MALCVLRSMLLTRLDASRVDISTCCVPWQRWCGAPPPLCSDLPAEDPRATLTYTGRSGGTALEMDAATLNLRIALLQVTAVRSRLGLPSATQHPLAKCCTTQMLIVAV